MKVVLGRSFGTLALIALAPGLCLVALILRLTLGPGIVRYETAAFNSRLARTRRFAMPQNALGGTLRRAHIDRLPILWELAAGNLVVVISIAGDRRGAASNGRSRKLRLSATVSAPQDAFVAGRETTGSAR